MTAEKALKLNELLTYDSVIPDLFRNYKVRRFATEYTTTDCHTLTAIATSVRASRITDDNSKPATRRNCCVCVVRSNQ